MVVFGDVVQSATPGIQKVLMKKTSDIVKEYDIKSSVFKGTSGSKISGDDIVFGSDAKSTQKLTNQMKQRGWSEGTVKGVVDKPFTTRESTNLATGNPATVYYNQQGGYVIVDDVTKAIVQISDNINPSTWIPDANIIDPYKP